MFDINKYRGKYIDKDGLKWITGEGDEVKIEDNNCTASIKGQYIIWGSLQKLIKTHNGHEIWKDVN